MSIISVNDLARAFGVTLQNISEKTVFLFRNPAGAVMSHQGLLIRLADNLR